MFRLRIQVRPKSGVRLFGTMYISLNDTLFLYRIST